MLTHLSKQDPQIAEAIEKELKRQQEVIELIPSENFVSVSVLEALGSVLTNKYSEGYPGNRYYGGTENVDITEQLAIDRAKQLFQAEHANVQPLSGAPANIAAYFALLKPGDTILGMDLSHGGHLTHGHPVTSMSKIFNFIRYKTDKETGLIDYDNLLEMAKEHQPKLILVGYSAYSREIDYQKVQQIADEVGALTMADIAHIAGLIAAGVMNNPVPIFDIVTTTTHKTLRGPRGGMILCKEKWAGKVDKAVFPGLQGGPHEHNIAGKAVAFGEALKPEFKVYAAQILKNAKALENKLKEHDYKIMFGTTENHLLLIDVSNKNLSGKQAQELLDSVGITCNKNMIPDDPRSPMDPSGIRLGTPAMTSRGFTEQDFELVGELIAKTLANPEDQQVHSEVKQQIQQLTTKYPLYPELNN
ncbi:serine hydroxymethyltransferase [Candidatus Falkowbacteria bacterium]|jgi:glycine hydroxymethyltransferase|nr:serine hydroxymethyltransferase [Candidatus Falkowbacteria bacterium]MBT6574232.1 serine hydroxymethyltransferase [Candidatus Falkowbacteria bacterium]MBT7348531.1 serine hydroxymethyltransferase [Candidatus Falkowbacteria bacterium]MBT7500803.1 serine hydroxymethyltransferase [Candidatus Falkowbacteria bacterium]